MMDKEGFRNYLLSRKTSEAQIDQTFKIVERLKAFQHPVTEEGFSAFSEQLMMQGENSYDNYLTLARYGRFTRNDDLFLAALDILDGYEVFDNLYKKAACEVGSEKRDEIFRNIALPIVRTPHELRRAAVFFRSSGHRGGHCLKSSITSDNEKTLRFTQRDDRLLGQALKIPDFSYNFYGCIIIL